MIADSGARRQFSTGAVRDITDGKGRCDLLPLGTIGAMLSDIILCMINAYIRTGERDYLREALNSFVQIAFENWETALLELSIHYEEGIAKYGERNWEKGIPLHCFIDSAVRHYLKWKRGDTDERHDRAVLWNLIGALWTQINHADKPELIDLPFAKEEAKHESN